MTSDLSYLLQLQRLAIICTQLASKRKHIVSHEYNINDLDGFLKSLDTKHGDLAARLRSHKMSTVSKNNGISLHAHYASFRGHDATVAELVDLISLKLVPFCLHRKHIADVQNTWTGLPFSEVQAGATLLYQRAVDLFKRARKKSNRNGEFGELIAYVLIEQVLGAPQLVAKMSLKTNSQMPVHGSDGIHIAFDETSDNLYLIWGEAKCYASVSAAISEAVTSIKESLEHKKMERELFLIEQYVDLSGIGEKARAALLNFLDPLSEFYNKRLDRSVVLIAFDFSKYASVKSLPIKDVETEFTKELEIALNSYSKLVDDRLNDAGLINHTIDFFFLPVPSVEKMRALFQDKIGWTP